LQQTNGTAASEAERDGDLGFLWDFWYPALRSTEIVGERLATAMLLEVPLVLGRTSEGKAFAMRDSCPHRGIPLSYGHFVGKTVECSYHGWRFDACSGQCVEIPSLTSQDKLRVDRIFAGHYPCEEQDGYVWVYMHAPGSRLGETVPAAPKLATFSAKYKITHLAYQLLKKRTGEPVTTTIDFILPNRRLEEIRSGKLWFTSQTTVTPVRRDLCRIDFVAAWNLFFLPVPIFRLFGKTFLRQDQETMIQQAEGLKHNPHLMLIDDADRPAKWYFALKANLLESRRTGAEVAHPMSGPVTLRWRS
jgi:nitrite reductase/ring-hydroxylating ferredoxin subunit